MMAQKPQPPLDPKSINEMLTNLRKQVSQIEGETVTMKSDAMSGVFNAFAQILSNVFQEKIKGETERDELKKTLADIYQGHPDIKIQMEKQPEDKKRQGK